MLVLSLSTLVEESIASLKFKELSGKIKSFDELLTRKNIAMLETRHKGLFSYLAFHPSTDPKIVEYVKSGTLSSDSGPTILVLFTLDAEAKWATPLSPQAFNQWIELDSSVHPSYQIIRILFDFKQIPPLPGIVFFEKFTSQQRNPVYVSLQGLSNEGEVRDRLCKLFSIAENAFQESQNKPDVNFSDIFSVALQSQKLPYFKAGKKSMLEWLIKAYQYVDEHKGDIVSAVGLFV